MIDYTTREQRINVRTKKTDDKRMAVAIAIITSFLLGMAVQTAHLLSYIEKVSN